MCRIDTVLGRAVQIARVLMALGVASYAILPAKLAAQTQKSAWAHVGGTAVSSGLAGLAGGPISSLWYSDNGNRLLVKTEAGRIFETSDFEHWQLNRDEALPSPDTSSQIAGSRIYRLGGRNLYGSDNAGKTWINLTGLNDQSVVGGGASALAMNPKASQKITIGNLHGLWRSMDGGITWRGLNEGLPNFPVARLLSQRSVLLKDGTAIVWNSGAWTPTALPAAPDFQNRAAGRLGLPLSAAVLRDSTAYAGTSDGRLFVSRDSGVTWLESPKIGTAAITRLWVDSDRPEVALAVTGKKLFRTINAGVFWDDVTGAMPGMELRSVTADRSASVIYVASDRGVFSASLSLNDAGPAATSWHSVSVELPAAPAVDLQYNLDGTLTAAIEGYGIYETQAPHKSRSVRLLSGADLTERSAAPGSLVSVIGAKLDSAKTGDLRYPVLGSSDSSTQLQVPFEIATGVLTIAMQSSVESFSLPVTIKESAPAIFVDADGLPLLMDSETGLVLDTKVALRAGARVQIMATGMGKVTPDWPTGMPAPVDSPPAVRGTVTAYLDGLPLEVTKATLAPGYVGYYTVELQLPPVVNKGASDLTLVMNGERSNQVKLILDNDR